MSAVLVTISGVLYDKLSRTQRPVVIVGEASLTGLGVGGGPIIPPDEGPPGIWGPTDPRPTPPINLPPGYPGNPPGIWGPTDPRPTPPIHIPPVPPDPPTPSEPKPPPADGGWGWSPEYGWGYFPNPSSGGKPTPLPPVGGSGAQPKK